MLLCARNQKNLSKYPEMAALILSRWSSLREFFPSSPHSTPIFMTFWRHVLLPLNYTSAPTSRHSIRDWKERDRGAKPSSKDLPAWFHGNGWWLVPAFFVSTRWRAPDIKIRFESTAISEATSPIFFPACGCRGGFLLWCGIALGLNYGCLLSTKQIVIVPSVP